MPQIAQAALQLLHISAHFLAWLNIGLCMHNIDAQRGEMHPRQVCLSASTLPWLLADGLSAHGTEHFSE